MSVTYKNMGKKADRPLKISYLPAGKSSSFTD